MGTYVAELGLLQLIRTMGVMKPSHMSLRLAVYTSLLTKDGSMSTKNFPIWLRCLNAALLLPLFCCTDRRPPARTTNSNPNLARSAATRDTGDTLRQLEAVEIRLRTEAERQAKHNGPSAPEEGELLAYDTAGLRVVWHCCNSSANRLVTYSVLVDSSGHATRADIIHSSGIASCDDAIKAAAIKSAWHCRRIGVNCRIESALSLGSPEHRRVIKPARKK